MSRLRRLRRRACGERGFTSFELVVGITVMLALSSGALLFVESASRTVGVSTKETQSLDQARVALSRMAGEIRGALAIKMAGVQCPLSTCLVITVPQPGAPSTDVRYRFDAQSHELLRATGDALTGIWGGEAPVATHLQNGTSPVFTRNVGTTVGTAAAIKIALHVNVDPSRPAQVIRLDSIITPRNL